MKKQFLFQAVFFSFLFSTVFSQTVYITKTGKKYHIESCRYLSQSSFEIKLSDAKTRGYDPCSVCKPPIIVTNTPSTKQKPTQTQPQTQKKETQSVQCSATTKAGTACKRITKSPNRKCWQHGGN